jgi:Flp pilus assembly pilin Flp
MARLLTQAWREEDGVLSFEWTMLLTLLTVGIVSGVAATRDGVIDELGDVAQAMLSVDGSYLISQPLAVTVDRDGAGPLLPEQMGGGSDSSFTDAMTYTDCDRDISLGGQNSGFPVDDFDS